MSDLSRLVARSHPEPPPPGVDGDCLIWHGGRNNNGYGYIADPEHPGRVVGVHRLSWTTQRGPVSRGLHVLHRCDRRACWTVGHLFLGTHADNMADMVSKGRTANGGTSQTHCKRGHPLAYLRSNGQRTCRFGSDPATSVLDPDCKAHEVDNLYVVDTSFFPSIGAVNPALTAMANALRVGAHLTDRLG